MYIEYEILLIMDTLDILLVIGVGLVAGFFNVVAAGGSLITIPFLIFLGLPPTVANGSNRVAVLAQNMMATTRYQKKKLIPFPFSIYPAISATIGAFVGALFVFNIDEHLFQRILAVVMAVFAFTLLVSPSYKEAEPRITGKYKWLTTIGFFFVGIYGGFLHAGSGVLMLLLLTGVSRFSLTNANAIKIFVSLIYILLSFGIYLYNDAVDWRYGLILAVGNTVGGWVGTQVVIQKGDKWIKVILITVVVGMSIKLWFF